MSRHTLPALVAETPLQPQIPVLIVFGRDEGGKPRAAWFGASDVAAAKQAAILMKMRVLPVVDDAHRAFAGELAAGRVFASGRAFTPYVRKELYARLVEIAGGTAGLSVAVSLPPPAEAKRTASDGTTSSGTDAPIAMSLKSEPEERWDEATVARPELDTLTAAAKPGDAPAASGNAPRHGERNFVGAPRPDERDQIGLGSIVLAHESPDDGWWEAEVIGINGRVFSLRWRDYPTQPTILRKAGELALVPPGDA